MTETKARAHLIADEKLGGVQREYIEVERKAVVGEYAIQTSFYANKRGNIAQVSRVANDDSGITLDDEPLFHNEYYVLEPTNTAVIDGQRYELAERKAEEGEKVLIVALDDPDNDTGYCNGSVATIERVFSSHAYISAGSYELLHEEYLVLIPVEPPAEQEPDIYAILANLTRRLASVESQLRDTQGNVERQAQELGNLEGRTKVIDSISDFYAEGQR